MGLGKRRLARLPTSAGVYLFKDAKGAVLYVGKAVNLRARVRQYFAGHDGRPMVPFLLRDVEDLDVVLVDTEKEALILENTLIKKHRPRYNAQLRDDKNFLHLRLDQRQRWPRFVLRRRIVDDGARYFGPFHSASRARRTLTTLQRAFPLRSCTDQVLRSRRRPCLLHQLGRCVAPCIGQLSREEYAALVEAACLFLEGRNQELLQRLRARMMEHAEGERFEEAAQLRDAIQAVGATLERQRVVDRRLGQRDVWGLYREGDRGRAAILPVREGFMQEPLVRLLEGAFEEDGPLLSSLLNRHYDPERGSDARALIPAELLLPCLPPDCAALEELLSERRGARVRIRVPLRGEKRALLRLAQANARERFFQGTTDEERAERALQALAKACRLPAPPRRIECFDNSNLQGSDPVAAMAVFLDGRPERSEYRRYRVKTVQGPDDYASMREILGRRFRRALKDGILPDLVVVDGGHGQLSAAQAVLNDLGLPDLPILGIVKPRSEKLARRRSGRTKARQPALDKVVLPNVRDAVRLRANDPALRLLQHLRDESHRQAVRYHRSVRSRRSLGSVLEEVPGIGPQRRKRLLRHFGSARRLTEAPREELAAVPGIGDQLAAALWSAFHPEGAAEKKGPEGGKEAPADRSDM